MDFLNCIHTRVIIPEETTIFGFKPGSSDCKPLILSFRLPLMNTRIGQNVILNFGEILKIKFGFDKMEKEFMRILGSALDWQGYILEKMD